MSDAISGLLDAHDVPAAERERLRTAIVAAGQYGARAGAHALCFAATVRNRAAELHAVWWVDMPLPYLDQRALARTIDIPSGSDHDRARDVLQRTHTALGIDHAFAVRAVLDQHFGSLVLAELGYVPRKKAA